MVVAADTSFKQSTVLRLCPCARIPVVFPGYVGQAAPFLRWLRWDQPFSVCLTYLQTMADSVIFCVLFQTCGVLSHVFLETIGVWYCSSGQCACAGQPGKSHTMSWRSLPDDVVELILTRLSLVELARVSATYSTFQAQYRRQLAREHGARCRLAVNYFGRKRITNITALIIQLLKGEPLNPSFCDPPDIDALLRGAFTFDLTAPTVLVFRNHSRPVDIITVEEILPTWKRLVVEVPRDRKGVQICLLPPGDDKHVEMLALVHAILSEGLAQFIHDAGMWCQVDISRH